MRVKEGLNEEKKILIQKKTSQLENDYKNVNMDDQIKEHGPFKHL